MKSSNSSKWSATAPWYLTIASTTMLIVLAYFLISNIHWFKEGVFDSSISEINHPEYRFYAYHLHLSMIKRSVGLFAGFALMFIGMGVVFYTLQEKIDFKIAGGGLSAALVTASPGIVALIIGATLMIMTIQSKDSFPEYKSNLKIESPQKLDPTKLPEIKKPK